MSMPTPASAFPSTSCRASSSASTASRARRAAATRAPGIGLALVQELVKLHGGELTVDEPARAGQPSSPCRCRSAPRICLPDQIVRRARRPRQPRVGARRTSQEALRWLPDGPQRATESRRRCERAHRRHRRPTSAASCSPTTTPTCATTRERLLAERWQRRRGRATAARRSTPRGRAAPTSSSPT